MSIDKQLDKLLERFVPEVAVIFRAVFSQISNRAVIENVVLAIEAGSFNDVLRSTTYSKASLEPLVKAIQEVFIRTGYLTTDSFPKRAKVTFELKNPAAQKILKNMSATLVTGIDEQVRESLREILKDGNDRGVNPRDLADKIVGKYNSETKRREGGIFGLHAVQTRAEINARDMLERGDSRYFSLKTRDKRFDPTVSKAFETGKFSKAEIDRVMVAYRNKALTYRAETIARTESTAAMNAAYWESHRQILENGNVEKQDITKTWNVTRDGRERFSHLVLGEASRRKGGIAVDVPFVTHEGHKMMYPGDISLGAKGEDVIRCRCRLKFSVDWIGALKRRGR